MFEDLLSSSSPKSMTKEEYEKRREKILKFRKQVLTIVEELIEPEISENQLIENCKYLSKNDYYDVTVERSITNYCGYPLCLKELKDKPTKKYKILLQTHQVFDITDRKMFCSNLCFTKSNYLKDQLEEEPLWIRGLEEDKKLKLTNIKLYKKSKGGSFGDEIKLDLNLTKDLIHELHKQGDNLNCKLYCNDCCKNNENSDNKIKCDNNDCKNNKNDDIKLDKSINFPYIHEDDLDNLKEKLRNLKIKEKISSTTNSKTEKLKDKPIKNKVIEKTDKIDFKF